jgi:cobalt-zinc-cadmium resistance protein CzcA
MKKLAVLIVFIAFPSLLIDLNSQQIKSITLQEAIQLALDNNLEIKSSGMSVDAMRALKSSSLDLDKTNFGIQYGQFNSIVKDNSMEVTQTISFPTVYYWQNRLVNEKIKGSEWQLKGSRLDIATLVKQVYYQLLYLYSRQDLLSYQDSLFTGFMRAAELRSKAGETNRLEMVTARSQSLEIKNQMNQLASDIRINSGRLKTLLNTNDIYMPSDNFFKREGLSLPPDSSTIYQNPTLGLLKQQADIAHAEKKLEGNRVLPDLNIGYFSQTIQGTQDVNGSPVTFGPGDRFDGVQAGIALPLWFVPYTARTKAAKINEKIAHTNAEFFEKTLSGDYKSLLDEFAKYSVSVDFYETQAIPEANMIIRQAELSYSAGAIDYLDFVQSLSRALTIKQNYLDAVNNLNQTKINIEFITGIIF